MDVAIVGVGLIGLGTLSLLFFASHLVHGPRLWRSRAGHRAIRRWCSGCQRQRWR